MSDNGFDFDVFLCHSSKDKPTVASIAKRLRADGIRVWFDAWVIKPGDNIPAMIEDGLERSRVLVLCMSAQASGSEWAQLESGTFRFRDPLNRARRLIPLKLDDAPIKNSLAQFRFVDWQNTGAYLDLLEAIHSPANNHEFSGSDRILPLKPELPPISAPIKGTGINPTYTFDSFIVGDLDNQFAYSTALAVALRPAENYNPLFIYGEVGSGKTHLLHALARYLAETSKKSVLFLAGQHFSDHAFTERLVEILTEIRIDYTKADILVIDDIQYVSDRKDLQGEIFQTIDLFINWRKQIVLSANCPPGAITGLDPRLHSRLRSSLAAQLSPPGVELRLAILQKKAQALRSNISVQILEWIAQNIHTDIRRLEGALLRVASYASLSGRELSPENIRELLDDLVG